MRHYYGELNVKQRNFVWLFYFANITVTEIDLDNAIWNIDFKIRCSTVAIAFFLSTETHAKRLLTIWKRSVWTTLKRSFTVLANQSIVSETFQAFRILANQISVRKTLSWKPCLVANVSSFASLVNQKLFKIFFFFFFFSVSLNYNNYSSHGFADVTFTILPYMGVPLSRFKIAFS